jgi:uncharacterized membrane protein
VVVEISAAAVPPVVGKQQGTRMNKFIRLLKHHWLDASDVRRVLPDDMAERLARRVAASESRHTGEVRLCVEASLPPAEVWRIGPTHPLGQVVRQRALHWFGRLGVWDTEGNNGVLIYLLLAERSIELVADRALACCISPEQWQVRVAALSQRLKQGDVEGGLTEALEEVSALLVAHFPAQAGCQARNELPNEVVRV